MTDKSAIIVAEANKRAASAKGFWDENYARMDDDIRFIHGEGQWPEKIKKQREIDVRPCLTFNMLPSYIDQVTGSQRLTTPSIDIAPVNSDTKETRIKNYTGQKDYSLAETFQAIIRNIEYVSKADIAYDTAFEHCAGWGLGWIRVLSDYVSDESFDQDFRIKRVKNYKSVMVSLFDEPDGSDIEWAIIFSKMTLEDFEHKWPGKKPADAKDLNKSEIDIWLDKDYVKIGEYYKFVNDDHELVQLSDGTVTRMDKVSGVLDELEREKGITVAETRKVKGKKVVWYKISGCDVLEGPLDTPFSYIPVIPVVGKELVVDGKTILRGVIRHAKDAQCMYNYSRTSEIESVGLQPRVPYIASDKQIGPYLDDWKHANTSNVGVLVYKSVPGEPRPSREPPPMMSSANINLSMQARDDIKGTTNMHDASMGAQSNETSGRAIIAREKQGDVGNYSFVDNLSRSIGHLARILVQAIPKVYDTNRLLRLRFPDGNDDLVEINQTILDDQTGKEVIINDLSVGKFDVICKTGPSFTTQRTEAAEAITRFISALGNTDPVTTKALTYLAVKNMDWADSEQVLDILKKTLPKGLIEDDEEDQKPQEPTPQELIETAKMEAEREQIEADKMTAQATMKTAEAKMMEAVEKINNLDETIKESIASALAEAMVQMQA